MGCAPSQPVSALVTHGTADPVVPFNGGPMVGRGGPSDIISASELAARLRQAGGDVVLKQIDGLGHIWPGDASEASAQFFASHAR
jgi:polyhydroxybutyrate depolymerase